MLILCFENMYVFVFYNINFGPLVSISKLTLELERPVTSG